MRFKKSAAFALAAIMAVSILPYSAFAEEVTTEAETEEEGEVITLGGETEYPVIVTGSDDAEVLLEKEPEIVVSLGPTITEMIYEIGAEDKLAARTDYCDYPSAALELPSIGTLYDIDIEAVLDLNPDLIISSAIVSDDVLAQFEDAGVNVLVLYEEFDYEGVYSMLATLGVALNHQDEAADAIITADDAVLAVEEALADEEPVSVYYVVGFGEYGDYTAGGDTYVNGLLEAAGGANIAADVEGWSYSTEELLEKDPEYIIIPAWAEGVFGAEAPYSELTAVKEGRVVAIDNNLLDRQTARNAEGILTIAQILHPDVDALYDIWVADYSLEEEVEETETETEAETLADAS